jgi:hypothetical protein
LGGHQPGEPVAVDDHPMLCGHLQSQVDREAVGVVQLKRLVSAEQSRGRGGGVTLGLLDGRVENRRTGGEGAPEGGLLGVGDRADPGEVACQFGIGGLHPLQRHRQQLGQARVVHTEQPHRPHAASQQPTKHVAAALVAGGHPVPDQHQA